MSTKNGRGTGPEAKQAVTDIPAPEVTAEMLASVDMDFMPAVVMDEAMGMELAEVVVQYHKFVAAAKSARSVGQHQEAETFAKQQARMMHLAALIQHEYPRAKGIATRIAMERLTRIGR